MAGRGSIPVFDNSPLYLRLTLIFPYTKGMLFQHAVFDRDGQKAFQRGLSQAPRFHPADHPSRRNTSAASSPPSRNCPTTNCRKGYKSLVGGSLGELEHQVMLEQYSGKHRRRRNCAALARLHLRIAGEQEGWPRGPALRGGVGYRRCRAPVFRRLSPPTREEMEAVDGRQRNRRCRHRLPATTGASNCAAKVYGHQRGRACPPALD